MKSGLLLTAATSIALLFGGNAAKAAWDFTSISDPLGTQGTVASGINDTGLIVGTYTDSSFNQTAFTLSGASYSTVTVSGAASSVASGVNNSGQISGYFTDGSGNVHGYVQTGGTTAAYDVPTTPPTSAAVGATYGSGINGAGTTVGYYLDNSSNYHGFVNSGATISGVDVTGVPGTPSGTQALGINGAGTIVGTYYNGTVNQGFIDVGGTFTPVAVPGATSTTVSSIDSVGDIAGSYTDGGGISHGFVDVDGTFYTVDDPNGSQSWILGFNNLGTVVGYYLDAATGNPVGFSADVPEPATLALFGLATVGLVAVRRRRAVSTPGLSATLA
jgi:hypothetical protein